MYEHELAGVSGPVTGLRAAVAMRSAGQVLAVRLLDRQMWDCQHADNVRHHSTSPSSSGSGRSSCFVVVVMYFGDIDNSWATLPKVCQNSLPPF